MKERPILFSAPMVRALLAGTKTQTRRILKSAHADDASVWRHHEGNTWESGIASGAPGSFGHGEFVRCPYGQPGDRLWARETHAQFAVGNRTGISPQCVAYRATCEDDGSFDYVNNGDEIMNLKITKWTPAIHMPRWATRITLEVTGVRVQRLQEIDGYDVIAEGIAPQSHYCGCEPCRMTCSLCPATQTSLCLAYADLWDEINGDRAPWSSNPWVWAITFKRVEDQR